jgi:hypothetical protein
MARSGLRPGRELECSRVTCEMGEMSEERVMSIFEPLHGVAAEPEMPGRAAAGLRRALLGLTPGHERSLIEHQVRSQV